MHFTIVCINFFILLDNLSEGYVKFLGFIEGKESAHDQLIHMDFMQHLCMICEDSFKGWEYVFFYFLFNTKLRCQDGDLTGSLNQQFSK